MGLLLSHEIWPEQRAKVTLQGIHKGVVGATGELPQEGLGGRIAEMLACFLAL